MCLKSVYEKSCVQRVTVKVKRKSSESESKSGQTTQQQRATSIQTRAILPLHPLVAAADTCHRSNSLANCELSIKQSEAIVLSLALSLCLSHLRVCARCSRYLCLREREREGLPSPLTFPMLWLYKREGRDEGESNDDYFQREQQRKTCVQSILDFFFFLLFPLSFSADKKDKQHRRIHAQTHTALTHSFSSLPLSTPSSPLSSTFLRFFLFLLFRPHSRSCPSLSLLDPSHPPISHVSSSPPPFIHYHCLHRQTSV